MTVAEIIAESVRQALEQIAGVADAELVAATFGNNAAAALAARPLEYLTGAATSLPGAANVDISLLPSGATSIKVLAASDDEAAGIAALLSLPPLELATDGQQEWLTSERGEWGAERVWVCGPVHDLCGSCRSRKAG